MWWNREYRYQNVKKNYSDFFTNEIREIEAGRQCFAAWRSLDGHECGSKTAHTYGFCAAFQPLKGSILAPERHVFAQKDGPREKKALTFFHGDIPFWKRGCSRKAEIWAKSLPVNEIANPSHFRVFFGKLSCREFWAILSLVETCFSATFVKTFYSSCIIHEDDSFFAYRIADLKVIQADGRRLLTGLSNNFFTIFLLLYKFLGIFVPSFGGIAQRQIPF